MITDKITPQIKITTLTTLPKNSIIKMRNNTRKEE